MPRFLPLIALTLASTFCIAGSRPMLVKNFSKRAYTVELTSARAGRLMVSFPGQPSRATKILKKAGQRCVVRPGKARFVFLDSKDRLDLKVAFLAPGASVPSPMNTLEISGSTKAPAFPGIPMNGEVHLRPTLDLAPDEPFLFLGR